VHRDIKPSNVLLAPGSGPNGSDHAYVTGFGLTTRLTDTPSRVDGASMGTIDYVAPEQIRGDPVDARAGL
jgi:serine/threonine protein kinase